MAEASKRIWTSGCIEIVRLWAERNLYTIGAVALGVALSQVYTIYFTSLVCILITLFSVNKSNVVL